MDIKRIIEDVFKRKEFKKLIENYKKEEIEKIKIYIMIYLIMTRSDNLLDKFMVELKSKIESDIGFINFDYCDYVIDFIYKNKVLNNINEVLVNYIENGYYYYGYNSVFLDFIRENGLSTTKKMWNEDEILEIKKIFNKRKINDIFGLYIFGKTPNCLYYNLNEAIYNAINSPRWFMHFTTGGYNVNDNYFKNAYLNNNYDEMLYNVKKMCSVGRLNKEETNIILEFFNKYYKMFCINNSADVLFIKKKSLIDKEYDFNDIEDLKQIKKCIKYYSKGTKIYDEDIDKKDLIFIDDGMEKSYGKYKRK